MSINRSSLPPPAKGNRGNDRKACLFAGAALFTATPALAQDLPLIGGARIELRGGWDDVAPVVTYTDTNGSQRVSGGRSGIRYGTEVGYDAMFGNGGFVGAYAGIAGSTNTACGTIGTIEDCPSAGRDLTAGVRVGFGLPHNAMVYIKGGYSNGTLTLRANSPVFANELVESQNLNGFHAGAGGEVGKIVTDAARLRTTVDRHQLIGGFGYRF